MPQLFKRRTGLGTGTATAAVVVLALAAASAPAASNLISTVAGNGTAGYSGQGTPAVDASFQEPGDVAALPGGGFLIADTKNSRIRKVSAGGEVTTVAGTGDNDYEGDGGPATGADLNEPKGVAPLSGGGFLIADTKNDVIRKVWPSGQISTVAGCEDEDEEEDCDDNGEDATETVLDEPRAVAPLSSGGFLIADTKNHMIRAVSASGEISTVAGTGASGFNAAADPLLARLKEPADVVPTSDGGFVIADTGNHLIRIVTPGGVISTVAGNTVEGFAGDGGPAQGAKLDSPTGVALTPTGGYLIADGDNNRIREVAPAGRIATVAGSAAGYAGDGGLATNALLRSPGALALGDGGVLIADTLNHVVRLLDVTFAPAPVEPPVEPPVEDPGENPGENPGEELPPPSEPVLGETFVGGAANGVVRVKLPGRRGFVELAEGATLPVGTVVDTRRGVIALTVAAPSGEGTQSGRFNAGIFQLRQPQGRPFTQLSLRGGGFRRCAKPSRRARGNAAVTSRRKRGSVRKLWGRGKGDFRTRGKNGSATVRGTVWLTADRCDGTLVKVRKGIVDVRSNRGGKAVAVRAGEQLLVPAARASRRRRR